MFEFIYDIFTIDNVKSLLFYVEIFFIIYLAGYSTFLFASVISGGNELFEAIKKRRLRSEIHHDYYIPISIIVPAYNEEVTIIETIKSLQNLDYKIYEIIIVNDGSSDHTTDILVKTFNLKKVMKPICYTLKCKKAIAIYECDNGMITLIDKINGGKADSLNMGINAATYPYFICMDADSILQKNSLTKIAIPILENQDVVAVGSMIRISNDSYFKDGELIEMQLPKKLIPALQVLEYERSFLASRIFLDKFNANLIISGAFGLFKKDAVIHVGGYDIHSIGEDMELIVKLHSYYRLNKLPYQIKYAYDAICWTQVPEHFHDLLKQRKRWHIGLFQSLVKHKKLFTSGSYLYYLIYELLSPFIEIGGLLFIALASLFGLLNSFYMVIFFFIYVLFGSLLTIISFLTRSFLSDTKIRFGDVIKAFLLCIPENMILRFILAWVRISSLLFYRGKHTKWGNIKRVKINYTNDLNSSVDS